MGAPDPLHQSPDVLAFAFEPAADALADHAGRFGNELPAGEDPFGDDLRRDARGRGADIGDKIRDGEIDLMADRRDDGDG